MGDTSKPPRPFRHPSSPATVRVQSSYPPRLPAGASSDAQRVYERRQLRLYAQLVSVLHEAIVVVDHAGVIALFNPAAERLFGRTASEVRGRSIGDYAQQFTDRADIGDVLDCVTDVRRIHDERIVITRPDGTWSPALVSLTPMLIGDHPVRFIAVFRDMTEMERQNEALARLNRELEALILVDEKTRVMNERGFHAELTRACDHARRFNEMLCVLYLDLTKFKALNDAYGHEAGDAAICEFAQRLQGAMYSTDTFARLHGDEFVIILPRTGRAGAVKAITDKVLTFGVFTMTFAHQQKGTLDEVVIRPAVGGVIRVGRNVPSAAEFIRLADQAMYVSKRDGKPYVLDVDETVPPPTYPPAIISSS